MHSQTPARFPFKKIALVVVCIYAGLYLLGIGLSSMLNGVFLKNIYFKSSYIRSQFISLFFHIPFYYFTLNSYYKLITGRKKFVHYLPISFLGALSYAVYILCTDQLSRASEAMNTKLSVSMIVFSYSMSVIFGLGIALLIAYVVSLLDEKKQRKILEEQKIALEVEKTNANFNFLKAQINPHFLHNTLNFLYSRSLPYSPELSEGILTLSEIMRYALNDTNTPNGKTLLKDEIEHVRNVIKINQLRFSNNLQVHFDVKGVINGATIIPFVLITIVENAFKHGNLKDTGHPLEIHLEVNDNQLFFYCRNKKKTGPKELSTGIGLDNIKKRLELAYKDQFKLDIKDEQDFYTTQLTIYAL